MTDLAPDVFTYGLAAGLSGSAFLATVILLATDDGVANVLGLLGSVLLVLSAAAALATVAAEKVRPTSGGGPALEAKLAAMDECSSAPLAHTTGVEHGDPGAPRSMNRRISVGRHFPVGVG